MGDLALFNLPKPAQTELRWSYYQLEHPSFAARLSDVLAQPVEEAMSLLPRKWRRRLDRTVERNMRMTLRVALVSLDKEPGVPASIWTHKALITGSGAVAGFFGPITALAELPLATTLILRAIADIARSQGEDLKTPEARLACVQVFALGGRTDDDQSAEIGYYALRATLGLHFEGILAYGGALDAVELPSAVSLVRALAARFGVVISDKLAVQMIPVLGALTAAGLNLIFMQHFQDVARGHFIVRRLEREHGVDVVREAYRQLEQEDAHSAREYSPVVGW